MVTIVKKGSDKKEAAKQLEKALKTKGVDTHKYCGVIKLREDPLKIQKKMRDEWE
jgi:hypothetical protein